MAKYGNAHECDELSIGLDYLPTEVANKVNANICNGGGGGGKQVTTTGIDPDIKRHVTPALADVGRLYQSGKLGQVADTSAVQSALAAQGAQAQKTMQEGLGAENLLNQLRATEGQMQGAQQGALGSARADRAREAGMVDSAINLQQADLQAKQQAGGMNIQAAEASRGLEQEVLDSDAKASERYFGYLAGAPQGQTQTTSGGGGK